MAIDPTMLLALSILGLAVLLSVGAGIASARIFFQASREVEEPER